MKNNEQMRNNMTSNFVSACVGSCQKLIAQIQKLKGSIVSEFREAFGAPEQLLHLAVNEAEALAWQTEYPYLVFPALAMEKARAVATWQARQRSIQHGAAYAFAS
jgi:hypothetical protein